MILSLPRLSATSGSPQLVCPGFAQGVGDLGRQHGCRRRTTALRREAVARDGNQRCGKRGRRLSGQRAASGLRRPPPRVQQPPSAGRLSDPAACSTTTRPPRLQASYVVTLLQPYHRNFGERLVKTPKLYFFDTGVLCHLLRIADPQTLLTHALRGAIFETWVVTEVIKHRYNQGLAANLYFWRDHHGVELDLVFEDSGRLHAVEVKSGSPFSMDWLNTARRWTTLVGKTAAQPIVVYAGNDSFDLPAACSVSWRDLK